MSISNSPRVRVVAATDLPTASVSILDSNYQTVARAGGSVEAALTPGVYKVRYSTGTNVVENIFEVSSAQTEIILDKPNLPTPRAAVSGQLLQSIEEMAVRVSTERAISHGTGSECFLFVVDLRRAESAMRHTSAPPHPATGLKLFTFEGTFIADLSQAPAEDGCAGCNLELNPGSYLLRLEQLGQDPLEMTVVTCATWQTQVILPLELLHPGADMRLPSFESATVLMAPSGQGFTPDDQISEWVRMACRWLSRGEPVAPFSELRKAVDLANAIRQNVDNDEALRELLRHKFTNPLLGIYAAHLLTLTPDPDLSLLREVSSNLKLLVGNHPDVIAIDLWLDPETKAMPFQSPPMLRNSWKILVNRSRRYEELVPIGSYSLRITGRLWGSGCWLIWRTPPPAKVTQPAKPVAVKALFQYVSKQMSGKTVSQFVQEQAATRDLTGIESSVLAYVASVVQSQIYVKDLASKLEKIGWLGPLSNVARMLFPSGLEQTAMKTAEELLSKDGIAQKLGIPIAAVNEAIAALETKLARRLAESKSLNATATVRLTQQTDCASWLAPSADGRLELFVRGSDGAVWHIWQTAVNNGWSNWFSHGSPPRVRIDGSPILAPNADGRLQLFVSSADGSLWSIVQTAPSSGWSNWASLGKPACTTLTDSAVVASNADGRLEVFAQGADHALWHIWQTTPNGDWSKWFSQGQPPNSGGIQGSLCLAPSQDGRLELFAIGNDGALWHIWQTAVNDGWSNWFSHGNPQGQTFAGSAIPPVLASQADGRLHLFVPSLGGEMWRISQTAVNNGWSDWVSHGRPSPFSDPAAIATNADGRLELFIPAGLGVWHIWQTTSNGDWSDWSNQLPEMPNGPVHVDGSPALAPSVDGRLEMFVLGFDKAIWHIWQTAVNNGWSAPFSHGTPPNVQLLPNR
ncbi:MAG TPA: hypothetical protein VK673_10875 [Chthoniobacterales bacterium]|nr:hypothetical protein [Chthoniobacterales bacterium]